MSDNLPEDVVKLIYEPAGEFWLCAGDCGQWKKGMAAAHNGSGYVCLECERAVTLINGARSVGMAEKSDAEVAKTIRVLTEMIGEHEEHKRHYAGLAGSSVPEACERRIKAMLTAIDRLTSEVSVEQVIELARKKYPNPDTYFSVEFSDYQMWKSVKLTVTDCGKVDGPALYCGAFCTIEELAAQLRDPAGA